MSGPLHQWLYPNDIAMRLAFNNRMHALSVSMLGRNLLFKLEFALCYWCVFVRFLASVAPINDGIDVCASARGHCLAWVVPQELDVAYEPAPTQEHSAWMLVCATHTLCSMQRMHFRLRSARVLVCAAHRSCFDAAHGFVAGATHILCSAQRIGFCLRGAWTFVCAAHRCFTDATRRRAHHAPHTCVNGARQVLPNRVSK